VLLLGVIGPHQDVRGPGRQPSRLEEEGIHPTVMREMITSPGGTTIAGLAVLEEKAFKGIIIEAIEKASKRAKELSL
jgi:pyrroline-5-carboxylate reductase